MLNSHIAHSDIAKLKQFNFSLQNLFAEQKKDETRWSRPNSIRLHFRKISYCKYKIL